MEVQKEFESNPTPSQPQSAPIDNVDKDQLQPPTDNLPVAGDGNDNELNDKKRKSSDVWNHFKRKLVNGLMAILLPLYSSLPTTSEWEIAKQILLSPHRSRLHENTLEALMCTQSWIKHEKQASIGIIGLMQYLNLKDKRFQSFQDSDSDEEISENTNSGLFFMFIEIYAHLTIFGC
ncbi:hypothetical protein QL285_084749 [Trifolium repens]|nr:hypothetical protein QL285_084749 [Trifolium repens]